MSGRPRRSPAERLSVLVGAAASVMLVAGWISAAAAHAEMMSPAPGVHVVSPIPPGSKDLVMVTNGIICRCGCNLSVFECQATMTCDVSDRMRAEAVQKLAQGMSPQEALASFAQDYGSQVLAAPTKTGFDLTAWILPPLFGLAGIVLIVVALRKWRPQQAGAADEEPVEVDPEYLAKIEDELKRET